MFLDALHRGTNKSGTGMIETDGPVRSDSYEGIRSGNDKKTVIK